jgi:hypothetical protein
VTAVALLVILLSGHHNVTWLPKFLTCGRFPWKAPTNPLRVFRKFLTTVTYTDTMKSEMECERRRIYFVQLYIKKVSGFISRPTLVKIITTDFARSDN